MTETQETSEQKNGDKTEETPGTPELAPKQRYEGTVVKTTLAGAIVDIGMEQPGIVHISRLKRGPVNRVEDVVEVGQKVEVWVRRVDTDSGLIDLSMVEPLELEWRDLKSGMVLEGQVTRLENFGAFVEIGAERPGLVHISEMSNQYVRNPGDVVSVGDLVEVKVIGVDRRKKRIKLSMKALEAAPAPEVKPEERPETIDEPVPTAMEVAMREAMERSKSDGPEESPKTERQKSASDSELEDILSRTLQQKTDQK